jgi:hypothetical protein
VENEWFSWMKVCVCLYMHLLLVSWWYCFVSLWRIELKVKVMNWFCLMNNVSEGYILSFLFICTFYIQYLKFVHDHTLLLVITYRLVCNFLFRIHVKYCAIIWYSFLNHVLLNEFVEWRSLGWDGGLLFA